MKPGYHPSGKSLTAKVFAARLNRPTETYDLQSTGGRTTCIPADGKNPGNRVEPTNWAYTVDHYQKFMGQIVERWPKGVHHNTVSGVVGGDPGTWGSWDRTALFNRALERLNAKAREATDWSETIAQANQVARLGNLLKTAREMAKNPTKVWYDYMSPKTQAGRRARLKAKTKRRDGAREKRIRDNIDRASSGWLQFQYGWQPLMGDIYGTALTILQSAQSGIITLHGGATQPVVSNELVYNTGMLTTAKVIKQVVSGKQGCRIYVTLDAKGAPRVDDFTTLNPWLLGWNLIPYSFVVDWFYDVGGYLEALETAFLLNGRFKSGYYTELNAWYLRETLEGHVPPNNVNFTVNYASARRRHVEFKRTVLTAWPFQNKPVLKADLGSKRMLSAAALLGTLLGRK